MSKTELLAEFAKIGVELNDAGRELFANTLFQTSAVRSEIQVVEVLVSDLGFTRGATIADIYDRAAEQGLSLCPIELGPHLRLQLLDQVEGHLGQPLSRHRAPPGSITVASPKLSEDDAIPKGFYLRRIGGVLWLRGYRSSFEHVWFPNDRFAFCSAPSAAA